MAPRETGFTTPSQTFDIVIIFERSPKKQAYFWLYSAVWVHLNVSIEVANLDQHCTFVYNNEWQAKQGWLSRPKRVFYICSLTKLRKYYV